MDFINVIKPADERTSRMKTRNATLKSLSDLAPNELLSLYDNLDLSVRCILNSIGVLIALAQVFYIVKVPIAVLVGGYHISVVDVITGIIIDIGVIIIPPIVYWGTIFFALWINEELDTKKKAV
ncbi:hypothetical protein ACFS7Z_13930 [Pontibacter toksunensis]|uniref:TMhelix containing protein n=1 Tax=Pontibacter toksunensis TaxID=1332631 RepID=A0ABW6BVY3_9BACT